MRKWCVYLLVVFLVTALLCPLTAGAAGSADLTVTALDWQGGDGQVKPGDELVFTVTVKNEGDTTTNGVIEAVVSFGTEELMTLSHSGALAAGASVKLTSKPWKAVEGDRMIAVRVNPAGKVAEANLLNNTRQTNLRVAKNRVSPAFNADIVAEAGMFDLTFSDDFNDLSGFDNNSTGREGYKWYIKRRWSQKDMTTADYSVKNGVLTMAYEDDRYTIGASTMDCKTHVGYTFTRGYLEARVRIPQALADSKSKTAIWSLPKENWCEGLKQGRYVEMDWMEYYGKSDYYGTTLHDIEKKSDGTQNWYVKSNGSNTHLNDEDWHVMGWLWEDNHLRCYIDGVQVMDQTWGPDESPMPMHRINEGDIVFDGVFEVMDQQDMMLFIAGSNTMPMDFDYVRIWQEGGNAPQPTTTKPTATTTVKPSANKTTAVRGTTVKPTEAPTTVASGETTSTTVSAIDGDTVTTTTAWPSTQATQPVDAKPKTKFPWVAVAVPVVGAAIGAAGGLMLKLRKK